MSANAISRSRFLDLLLAGLTEGRELVPLTGAGISADSGVPTLAGITGYLARVRLYLRRRLYLPPSARARRGSEGGQGDDLLPSQFHEHLSLFGWPDPNRLTSTVWRYLLASRGYQKVESRRRMRRAVEVEILSSLEQLDWKLARRLQEELEQSPILDHGLRGDHWRHLLMGLTRADPDLTDTLFQRLVAGKEPGSAHRYLAFLTPILGIRLFLTYNFDPFIEDALNREGVPTLSYDVADSAPLPAPQLLQDSRSVVKLHGTRMRLVADTRVQRPLSEDMRRRLLAYLQDHSLLLVLGIGGWEERVLDTVDLALSKPHGQVFWLHFQESLPEPVEKRWAGRPGFWSCRALSPGGFLQELFERRCQSHPSIRRPYSAYSPRPLPLAASLTKKTKKSGTQQEEPLPNLRLFVDLAGHQGFGGSMEMAREVARRSETHSPIWVNLQNKYSAAEIIADLLHQLRRYDNSLPPEILPLERSLPSISEGPQSFRKATRRILSALGRGKYVVAFDGISSFGRPPTWHHGIPRGREGQVDQELGLLRDLAEGLKTGFDGRGARDSLLFFCLGTRRFRFSPVAEEDHPPLLQNLEALGLVAEESGEDELLPKGQVPSTFHCFLAAFRIRRSHVALVTLGWKFLFPEGSQVPSRREDLETPVVDELKALRSQGWIEPAEDGSWWMPRALRNRVYERFSGPVTRTALIESIQGKSKIGKAARIRSLDALISVHHRLARYFTRLGTSSSDAKALIEALYHRIATLRYLTKLQVCLAHGLLPCFKASKAPSLGHEMPDLFDRGALDPEALKVQRRELLHTLANLLLRNSALLRAKVPAPSMVRWLRWFRIWDCHRFCLEGWYRRSSSDAKVAELAKRDLPAIRKEVRQLEGILIRLESRMQTDSMSLLASLEAAAAWFGSLEAVPPPPQGPESPEQRRERRRAWLGWCRGATLGREFGAVKNWSLEALNVLFTMVQACIQYGDEKASSALCEVLEDAAQKVDESFLRKPQQAVRVLEFLPTALACRARADQLLINASPWDVKGQSLTLYRRLQERSEEAAEKAKSAIGKLEANSGDLVPQISYLQSLRARALAIRGDFSQAYREMDDSRAGLETLTPERRKERAISLLRLAECVLLRSDQALLPREQPRNESDLTALALRAIKSALAEEAKAKRSELLRSSGAQSMGNWENRAFPARGGKIELRLRKAKSRLARTRDHLRSAQRVLDRTRRATEWWICLFQLRIQLEVETMLLLTVEIQLNKRRRAKELKRRRTKESKRKAAAEAQKSWEDWHQKEKVPYLKRLHASLSLGLLGVRRSLDILLPEFDERREEDLARDRRLNRVLRLWLELMICGADLTLRLAAPDRLPNADQLWEDWRELNHEAGLWRLPEAQEVKAWLNSWLAKGSPLGRGSAPPALLRRSPSPLASRARLINQIDACLQSRTCLPALRSCLVP